MKRLLMFLYSRLDGDAWGVYLGVAAGVGAIALVTIDPAVRTSLSENGSIIGHICGYGASIALTIPSATYILGKIFIIRATPGHTLVAVDDYGIVTEIGKYLWKNHKYSYKQLMCFGQRKVRDIEVGQKYPLK